MSSGLGAGQMVDPDLLHIDHEFPEHFTGKEGATDAAPGNDEHLRSRPTDDVVGCSEETVDVGIIELESADSPVPVIDLDLHDIILPMDADDLTSGTSDHLMGRSDDIVGPGPIALDSDSDSDLPKPVIDMELHDIFRPMDSDDLTFGSTENVKGPSENAIDATIESESDSDSPAPVIDFQLHDICRPVDDDLTSRSTEDVVRSSETTVGSSVMELESVDDTDSPAPVIDLELHDVCLNLDANDLTSGSNSQFTGRSEDITDPGPIELESSNDSWRSEDAIEGMIPLESDSDSEGPVPVIDLELHDVCVETVTDGNHDARNLGDTDVRYG